MKCDINGSEGSKSEKQSEMPGLEFPERANQRRCRLEKARIRTVEWIREVVFDSPKASQPHAKVSLTSSRDGNIVTSGLNTRAGRDESIPMRSADI